MSDYRLIHGDCLDILPSLEAGSVDLCLTDPPYGIEINRRAKLVGTATHRSRKATDGDWDDAPPDPCIWPEIFRVSHNQVIFGANYFWEHFYSSQCYIVWDKRGSLPSVPFCDTEFAWTSFVRRPSKRYVVVNHGFIRDSRDKRTGHPTQKPTELFSRILHDFTSPDDLILDPFMGSGTTGVACIQTGRRFIGIEKDARYFEMAQERIERASQQLRLAV